MVDPLETQSEKQILADLTSKWVTLAAEYAGDAPGVTAYYIYGSDEGGSLFANAYFEQDGVVKFPGDVDGTDTEIATQASLQRLLKSDIMDAADAFAEIDVPAPTEYRLQYVLDGGKLDFQLSREELYGRGGRKKSQAEGIEYWLGERAPRFKK